MEHKLRFYIYYSDDKIKMLRPQVPQPWFRRFTSRIAGGGLSVLGTGGNVELHPPDSAPIIVAMETVCEYLADQKLVGTFDEPKQFFHGELECYYGVFELVNPPVFFLVGTTDQTIVALGGSRKHVQGFRDQIPVPDKHAQPVVMEPDVFSLLYEAETPSRKRRPKVASGEDIRAIHVAGMHQNLLRGKRAQMKFEVFGHQELLSPVSPPHVQSRRNVLIGSPVFVAKT